MLIPRHYQEDAIQAIFAYFASGAQGNPVVALPTGTGKSIVIAEFIRRALTWYPQTRILVVTHVKELVQQNFLELLEVWPQAPAGIYSAGLGRRDVHYPVTFCGIASIVNRVADFGWVDLVLVDECHTLSPKNDTMYSKALEALKTVNPSVRVIGLSATPFRLGLGMITEGGLFTDICCDWCSLEKFNQLVDEGFIAPLIPKQTSTELDVAGVDLQGGEYVASQLQAAVDKESITRAAIEETLRHAEDRHHWLVFCTGTEHADHTTKLLNEMGVVAVAVHSKLEAFDPRFAHLARPKETPRDLHIRLFKEGLVRAVVSVGVLTTGFNYRPVDLIVMLRPTMSPSLWVQMLGRGTRPAPDFDKLNCLVLDFAANTKRLGPINDPVIPRKKGKKRKGPMPYKVCPACATYNHARAAVCIHCGEAFPEQTKIGAEASEEALIRRQKKEQVIESHFEEFDVTRIDFAKHQSRDPAKPPSLKITYQCGFRIFNEWWCLEHTGFASKKARDAWRYFERSRNQDAGEPPESVDIALERVGDLAIPSKIRVLVKPKFSEVVGYTFAPEQPTPDHELSYTPPEDDEIPF